MFGMLLFVVFVSQTELAFSDDCETPWVKVGSKCLLKSATEDTRSETLVACEKLGGKLVSPKTNEENQLLKEFIGDKSGFYWLSGKLVTRRGIERSMPRFKWMDDRDIINNDWVGGQAKYFQGGDVCMKINGVTGWEDSPCDQHYMQLCEK